MPKQLFAVIVLVVGVSSQSHAAAFACEELFRGSLSKAASEVSGGSDRKSVAETVTESAAEPATAYFKQSASKEILAAVSRLVAPRFEIADYDSALASYRAAGPSAIRQPVSREERLAFLTYTTNLYGRHPYDLERLAKSGDPKAVSHLVRSFGKIDAKNFSPTQIDDIFFKIMKYAEPTPNTYANVYKMGSLAINKIALEQWATKEIASHSAKEAFSQLGRLQDARGRKKWLEVLKKYPNLAAVFGAAGVDLVQKLMTGTVFYVVPSHSRLRVTRLDPVLRKLIEEQGFDAAYPMLEEKYGRSAAFDQAFFWARRAVTVAMMGYVLQQMFPSVMTSLGQGLVSPNDSPIKMIELVFGFYTRLGGAIVYDRLHHSDARETKAWVARQPKRHSARAAAPVEETKMIKVAHVTTFDDEMNQLSPAPGAGDIEAASAPGPGSNGANSTAPEDKALKDNLDYLDNASIDDPTGH